MSTYTETITSDQQENDNDKHEESDGDKTDENNNTETHHEVENKSNERESSDDNKTGENNNGDILNENDIFLAQSTVIVNQDEAIDYDIDINEMLNFTLPLLDGGYFEPEEATLQCTLKNRRNSLYEYFRV